MSAWPSGRIDLHTHTTASDGTLAPEQLVEVAIGRGISVLGITDHDSVQAIDRARDAAAGSGLRIVAGLELSTRLEGLSVHLLAYGIDVRSPSFSQPWRTVSSYAPRERVASCRGWSIRECPFPGT